MNTKLQHLRIAPVDPHAAIARARASRAKFLGGALAQLPELFKRVTARRQTSRRNQRHFSAWA